MTVSAGNDRSAVFQIPRRGPGRVALDLWRAGGTFRGFIEFAMVGALVLAFLHGGVATNMMRSLKPPALTSPAQPRANAIEPPGKSDAKAELFATPADRPAVAPRLADINLLPAYFSDVPQPLRQHLQEALDAYSRHNALDVERALAGDDPDNRLVLMLRGLAQLRMPGRDAVKAGISMLERSVEKGEPRATAILGVFRMNGLAGYPRDLDAGRALLERAVELGDAPAARVVGQGFVSGYSGSIDPARAQHYLRLASDRGDLSATFQLGEMFLLGRGVPTDEAEGERLMLKAAEAGHSGAQASMGTLRLKPYLAEVADNASEALAWYERSAAQGNSRGMFNLGVFYGDLGRRTGQLDLKRSVDLFRRCVDLTQSAQCAFAYAAALDYGFGTPRDPIKAFAFYSLAAMVGTKPKAEHRRDEIGKTLSAAEREQATVIANQMLGPRVPGWVVNLAIAKPDGDGAKATAASNVTGERLVPRFKHVSPNAP